MQKPGSLQVICRNMQYHISITSQFYILYMTLFFSLSLSLCLQMVRWVWTLSHLPTLSALSPLLALWKPCPHTPYKLVTVFNAFFVFSIRLLFTMLFFFFYFLLLALCIHIYADFGTQYEHMKASSRWCPQTLTAALWIEACTYRIHMCTPSLETLINKSLKHLVKWIICFPSERCPASLLKKGADNFSHISIILQADVFTVCQNKDMGYIFVWLQHWLNRFVG